MVSGSINLGSTKMEYYHQSGHPESMPVLFLHPWFGCWQFWQQTMGLLPQHSYAVDWYSIGKDSWQPFASPISMAVATLHMLDELEIARCILVGNSMGGISAQVLAASFPDRIAKLILVGTGATTAGIKADFRSQLNEWVEDPDNRLKSRGMVLSLLSTVPPADELETYVTAIADANKDFMKSVLVAAGALDLRAWLPRVTAETLVIRGEFDRARTREHVRDIVEGIPTCTAVELPSAGHSPMVDSLNQFVAALNSFLGNSNEVGRSAGRTRSGRLTTG
jgi:3-oxoadipate enol-lactonase